MATIMESLMKLHWNEFDWYLLGSVLPSIAKLCGITLLVSPFSLAGVLNLHKSLDANYRLKPKQQPYQLMPGLL